MSRASKQPLPACLVAGIAIAAVLAGCAYLAPAGPATATHAPAPPAPSAAISIAAPAGTYHGRAAIPVTFSNQTAFTAAWVNIDGGANSSIPGNTTIDLRNATFGVREDGLHVLHLHVQLSNGTIVHVAAPFTVYSLQLLAVLHTNRVHGLYTSFLRHDIAGLDTLVYFLDNYEPPIAMHPAATNLSFNVNYVSMAHRLQLAGYNASENYTFWSNPATFSNIAFSNATGSGLAITIVPNMPSRLVAGAVATFVISIRNTGSITLHRLTMHVGARNPATGKVANQTLGGADLEPGARVNISFSFVLSRQYDVIIVPFNVTADEYCVQDVVAYYAPSGLGAFLEFLFPWGTILIAAIVLAVVVASYYRNRLRRIRQAEIDAARGDELEKARRFMERKRETDRFLEREKPRLDFQTETDFYGREVPRIGGQGAAGGPVKDGKVAGKDVPLAGKDAGTTGVSQAQAPATLDRVVEDVPDLNVDVQRDKCIVHAGPIKGVSYICPSCGARYCLACATTLKDQAEGCWQCKQGIEL